MITRFLASLALTCAITAPAMAVELRDASNQQILDELAFRLRLGGGGGGGSGGGAQAFYSCDSQNYLRISVIGPSGAEDAEAIYIGSGQNCSVQSQQLNASRTRITRTEVAAICDSGTYLKRFSITPEGVLGALQQTYVGNMSNCLSQARSINTSN